VTWVGYNCSTAEARNHVFKLGSAVKTVAKLYQVTWQVFITDRMIATMDRIFHIPNQGIDLGESFQSHSVRASSRHNGLHVQSQHLQLH